MKRSITEDLIKWKNHKRRKPLMLTGVRQCGKTYTINALSEIRDFFSGLGQCLCVNGDNTFL